jgi:hypothetical protein
VRQSCGDLRGIVLGDAGERNHRLVPDLRARIAQSPAQALRGARVAELPERRQSHLPNRGIGVLDRYEERGETFSRPEIGHGNGGLGANPGCVVISKQPLERWNRARAHGILGQSVPYEVADGGRARCSAVRRDVSEARLQRSGKRRRGEHQGLRIACSAPSGLDVKDASSDEQSATGRKNGERPGEQDVGRPQHRRDSLIQNSAKRHAVRWTEPHEGERRFADNHCCSRRSELNCGNPQQVRNDVKKQDSERAATERRGSLDEQSGPQRPSLNEGKSSKRSPGRQRKNASDVESRRRSNGAQHGESHDESGKGLDEVARSFDESLDGPAK